MVHGKRIPGEEAGFDEHRWKRDPFLDLHNDDALWAYMIHCSEEFRRQDWTEIHWGRGALETSGNILGKLQALDHFPPNVTTNHIWGTSRI